MKKILTVTLNPAIDTGYHIENFEKNEMFRAIPNKTAGGKGLNVSRVLRMLDSNVSAMGFLGGGNGRWIAKEIETLGIKNLFVEIKNDTRICIAILGENTQTEILEPGPEILEEELKQILDNYKTNINDYDVICISGGVPKNVPVDFYKTLCEIGKEKKVILDTSGEQLVHALEGNPFLIKPNKDELESFFNKKLNTLDEIIESGKKLQELGAKNILISLGGDGGVYIGEDIYKINIPKINVINPVGSGDSTIAGFAYGLSKNFRLEDILKYSMACGMSNAMSPKTGNISQKEIKEFVEKIIIIKK